MSKFNVKYTEQTKFDKFFSKKHIGFRTNNSTFFKNIIGFVSNVTDQINIKLEEKGVTITSMDSSHIALINCLIPLSLFSGYNLSNTEDSRISIWGVNLEIFLKILNQIKPTDELIVYQNKNNDAINISLINERYKKHYCIKLMNIDNDELAIQDIPDTTIIKMESRYFNEIIKDCLEIDEVINIVIKENSENNVDEDNDNEDEDNLEGVEDNEDNICFVCEGDMTSLNMVIHKDDIEYENLQNLNSKYSLPHIHTFSKAFNLNKNMKLEIGDGVPIKLTYKIFDSGFIEYFLAPKFEDDD